MGRIDRKIIRIGREIYFATSLQFTLRYPWNKLLHREVPRLRLNDRYRWTMSAILFYMAVTTYRGIGYSMS